jgi:hypothetical protein
MVERYDLRVGILILFSVVVGDFVMTASKAIANLGTGRGERALNGPRQSRLTYRV